MGTHCQTAAQGGGMNANIWGQLAPWRKKGGGQLHTKNPIEGISCKICLFSLYFVNKYTVFLHEIVCGRI